MVTMQVELYCVRWNLMLKLQSFPTEEQRHVRGVRGKTLAVVGSKAVESG